MAMETKQKEKKKENRFYFLYIFGGGILKEDFIVRHTKMIVLVVVLIFIFIGNRYVCMQRLREIERPSVLMNLKEKCDAPECNPTGSRKARTEHEL